VAVTKKSLVKNISEKLELSQKDSSFFLESFLSFIKLNSNIGINIQSFGTFVFKKAPKRIGRDPKSKKEYIIKAREKLIFQPSSKIKQEIN
tara:strand:+ start:1773 stop:2045 length:273 start_codon:yes stop_codon:yes gene_type:complete